MGDVTLNENAMHADCEAWTVYDTQRWIAVDGEENNGENNGMCIYCRVVLDSFLGADSTLTHMTIQVTQLRLNSNPKFANLTQLI